jgi:hypothetical protein
MRTESYINEMNSRVVRSTERLDRINGHLEHLRTSTASIERNVIRLAIKAGIESPQEEPSH